jgi:hypothetical protein
VKSELQRLAEQDRLSLSTTAGALLTQAVRQNLHEQHATLLQPIIEQAIRDQVSRMSTRLALLLVRVAFDVGQTRRLVTNILGRSPGVSPDMLDEILDASSAGARNDVLRRSPQLAGLMTEVEQWLAEEEPAP